MRRVPRELRDFPAVRFNRLSRLERLLTERREREIENGSYAGAQRALRWEEKIRAELMISAPFEVQTFQR